MCSENAVYPLWSRSGLQRIRIQKTHVSVPLNRITYIIVLSQLFFAFLLISLLSSLVAVTCHFPSHPQQYQANARHIVGAP